MKLKELKVMSLDLIDEKIIPKIISIQYDKEDDLYIIFYKEDKSESSMNKEEMISELMELGCSSSDTELALYITNFNFEEAKELLYLYTISDMHITYELLKLKKRVEKLEKDRSE